MRNLFVTKLVQMICLEYFGVKLEKFDFVYHITLAAVICRKKSQNVSRETCAVVAPCVFSPRKMIYDVSKQWKVLLPQARRRVAYALHPRPSQARDVFWGVWG